MAIAILIGLLLNLNRDEWFVAITFGVLIDADHLFATPRYVADNGLGAILRPTWDDASGEPWKSLYHDPVGAFIVFPLAIGWRYLIPFLFWGSHLAIDEFQLATLEYSAIIESAVLVGVVGGIVYVTYSRWGALREEPSLRAFFAEIWGQTRTWFSQVRVSIRTP